MSTEHNKAIVRRQYVALNQGESTLPYFTENCISHISGNPDPLYGLEALEKVNELYATAFSDLHITYDELIAERDKVAAWWTIRMTHTGWYHDLSATGRNVVLTGTDIFRIEGDKIAELWITYDTQSLMQQLGVPTSADVHERP